MNETGEPTGIGQAVAWIVEHRPETADEISAGIEVGLTRATLWNLGRRLNELDAEGMGEP